MTTAQKLKDCQKHLADMKEAKHHLGLSERQQFKGEIKMLERQVKDRNKLYDLVGTYKANYENERARNDDLRKENARLERKIKFLHKNYKQIIKDNK